MIVDLPSIEAFLVTLIVTAIRTGVESSPTILGGVAVAAWLRTLATPEKVDTIFSGDGLQGSIRTALVGMTLPVCSIGILPVLRELRQLGLPTSKLITLGLAAPLLNPFSLLFGLTVLSFPQYLMMIGVTGVLAVVVGDIGSRFATLVEVEPLPRPAGLTGITRMRNLIIAAGRLVTGRTLLDLVLTIVISGLTLSLIRYGAFFELCETSNRSGPAIASALTLTQYVSPLRGIIQFAGIDDANLATATGLAIYVFGTGIGGATILAFSQRYGLRRMLAMGIAVLLVVGSISYAASYTLPAPLVDVAETNTLDNLTRPAADTLGNLSVALEESLLFLNPFMIFGSVGIVILALAGIGMRLAKIEFKDDDPVLAEQQNEGKVIPASQLGAVAVTIMGIFFCVSTYIFFPSPYTVMQEMDRYRMDARIEVQSGNVAAAVDRIAAWDSAAASVPIGAAIRGSFPTEQQRKSTRDMRTELRKMRDLLNNGDLAAAQLMLPALRQIHSETKKAFGVASE